MIAVLEYVKDMSDAMNIKAAAALGAPDEHGDVDKIISAVQDFMETYREWIRCKLRFERETAIPGYHHATEALISVVDGVLSGVDELYKKLLSAKNVYDDYLAGKISLNWVEIDLSVSYKPLRLILTN